MKFLPVTRQSSLLTIAGLALTLLIIVSCAKEIKEADKDVELRYLDAYMLMNYPGVTPEASGLYFMPRGTQYGGTVPVTDDLLYVRYTHRQMDSTISTTTIDSLADLLGTRTYATYYGPQLFSMAKGEGMIGMQEAFSYMAVGDKARTVLPSWLTSYIVGGSKSYTYSSMYDIELLRIITDIAAYQTDSLKQFSNKYYGGADSSKYDWYFISQTEGTGELPVEGDTMVIRYAGYLLDGFMFDTNIKDTAVYELDKANARWNSSEKLSSSATFDSLTVIMKTDVTKMGVVTGFGYALQNMRDSSEAVTFFSSDYGYSSSSSGQVQPYSMLRFYMKVRIGRVATTE